MGAEAQVSALRASERLRLGRVRRLLKPVCKKTLLAQTQLRFFCRNIRWTLLLRSVFHRPFALFLVFLLSALPVPAQQSGDSSHTNPGRNADRAATQAADDRPRSVGPSCWFPLQRTPPTLRQRSSLAGECIVIQPQSRIDPAKLANQLDCAFSHRIYLH
jgi:hypothetical protein